MDHTTDLVTSFVHASREYCRLVDEAAELPRRGFLERVQRTLARLYALALELPEVAPDSDEPPQEQMSHEEWCQLFRSLGEYLGPADMYWMVSDPFDEEDHASITTTLSDDLSDIYRDLKASIPDEGAAVSNDTLWSLRFSFETHWGHHSVSALTAIHALLYGPHALPG